MRTIPVVVVVAAVLAAGCASGGAAGGDGKVHVVASFFPLAEAAAEVGGGAVEVTNLTKPGAEPHDLELTTRQVDDVLDADLAVIMGHGFQPDVEDAADNRDQPTVVVLDELGLQGEVHEGGKGLDPHVWLDPVEMRAIVASVTDGITTALPAERRQAVRNRARRYDAELAALAGRYQRGLERCRSNTIVTSHAAFGWLARSAARAGNS